MTLLSRLVSRWRWLSLNDCIPVRGDNSSGNPMSGSSSCGIMSGSRWELIRDMIHSRCCSS